MLVGPVTEQDITVRGDLDALGNVRGYRPG